MKAQSFSSLTCCVLLGLTSVFADTTITYVATNVPVAIPDGPSGIANSPMQITDAFEILDINVIVTITHTFDQDLRIYLEGPNEDVALLADQCGQSGNNYILTRFDDEATTPICSGSPPFTGNFRPERALSLFDGLSSAGTWICRVTDNAAQDVGTIDAWSMEVTYAHVSVGNLPSVVNEFQVLQNYPNPFNLTTHLPIELTKPTSLRLQVFDELGRTVFSSSYFLNAGRHELLLDGTRWSSGSYFAQVSADGLAQTQRIVLLK